MYVVIVTGDRKWTNKEVIARELAKLPEDAVIVQGAAPGADSIADFEAKWLGLKSISVPAHWRHGVGCGPDCREVTGIPAGAIRNRKMLNTYLEDVKLVLAFHNDLTQSRGTKDMVTISKKAGIPVSIFTEWGPHAEI